MPPSLQSLPTEILELIAVQLRSVHTSSFVSFTWVSKTIRSACLRILFSHVTFGSPSAAEVDRCLQDLSRNHLLTHVRRLTLRRPQGSEEDRTSNVLRIPGAHEIDRREVARLREIQNSWRPRTRRYPSWTPSDDGDDKEWAPVVELLKAVPELADLEFDWRAEIFPRCLLDHLVGQMPSCRLTMPQLEFQSIRYGQDMITNPLQITTVSCPNLHEVRCVCVEPTSLIDEVNYGAEAIMDMARGVAPNLTSISVESEEAPIRMIIMARRRRPWKGFSGISVPSRKAPVTSLRLDCESPLRDWYPSLDSSLIRSLSLGSNQLDDAEGSLWLIRDAEFPNLKQLSLEAGYLDSMQRDPATGKVTHKLSTLLGRLPPLEDLHLLGFEKVDQDLLKDVFRRNGPTLLKLRLDLQPGESFDRGVMQELAACCPVLRELEIPVKRSCGNADESAIYNSLGTIKSLRRAKLYLTTGFINAEERIYHHLDIDDRREYTDRCWDREDPPHRDEPSWDDFDWQLSSMSTQSPTAAVVPVLNGDIRNTLINFFSG